MSTTTSKSPNWTTYHFCSDGGSASPHVTDWRFPAFYFLVPLSRRRLAAPVLTSSDLPLAQTSACTLGRAKQSNITAVPIRRRVSMLCQSLSVKKDWVSLIKVVDKLFHCLLAPIQIQDKMTDELLTALRDFQKRVREMVALQRDRMSPHFASRTILIPGRRAGW